MALASLVTEPSWSKCLLIVFQLIVGQSINPWQFHVSLHEFNLIVIYYLDTSNPYSKHFLFLVCIYLVQFFQKVLYGFTDIPFPVIRQNMRAAVSWQTHSILSWNGIELPATWCHETIGAYWDKLLNWKTQYSILPPTQFASDFCKASFHTIFHAFLRRKMFGMLNSKLNGRNLAIL